MNLKIGKNGENQQNQNRFFEKIKLRGNKLVTSTKTT